MGQKNILVPGISSGEKITVIPHTNGDDFWIILPTQERSNTLNVYQLNDATGLSGVINTFVLSRNVPGAGYLKANLSGDKIVVGTDGPGLAVMDFDASSGTISNEVNHSVGGVFFVYGIEFSPNEEFIYFTQPVVDRTLKVLEIATGTITNIPLTNGTEEAWALQLGPDSLIYVATNNGFPTTTVGAIQDPNQLVSTNGDYDGDFVTFGCIPGSGGGVFRGLPSFVPPLVIRQTCVPPAEATISANPGVDFCEGESITLNASVTNNFFYAWLNQAGDTVLQGLNETSLNVSNSGQFTVSIADPIDLSDATCRLTSAPITVTEHSNPVIAGPIDGPGTVCEGSTAIDYTLQNTSGFSSITWGSPTNGAVNVTNTNSNPITVNFANVTNINQAVTLSVTVEQVNGTVTCTSTTPFTRDITIESLPTLSLSATSANVACNSTGNTITIQNFDANSTYNVVSATTGYNVSVNGSTIEFDVNENNGSFVIQQVSANNCESNQVTVNVNVIGCGIEANFTVSDNSLCSDATVVFDATSSNAGGNGATITNYSWIFPNEFTITNSTLDSSVVTGTVTNTGTTPITVSATLTITNNVNLTDDTVQVNAITINPNPPTVGISQSGSVCEGEDAIFTVAPFNPNSTYTWSSTATLGATNNDFTTVTNGTTGYIVKVVEENEFGCIGDTAQISVTPEATPLLEITPTNPTVNCNSTGNFLTILNFDPASQYTASSTPNTIVTSVSNDTVFFDVAQDGGTITVMQTTANGCVSNEATASIVVIGCGVEANFTVTNEGCANDTIVFTSISDPGLNASIVDYDWTFPAEVNVLFFNADSSEVTATVNNITNAPISISVSLGIETSVGLMDDTTIVDVITINPLPADIDIVRTGLVCQVDTSFFSVNPSNPNSTYVWSAINNVSLTSNGATASAVNGVTDYTVIVQETNEFGCIGVEDSLDVTIETTPIIDLEVNAIAPACFSSNNVVLITNFDATSNYTAIGNPASLISTVQNDSILINVGDETGTITVQQTTANGCISDEVTIDVSIIGCGLIADFTVTTEACANDTVVFDGTLSDAGNNASIVDYNWTFPSNVTPITSVDSAIVTAIVTNTGTTNAPLDVTLEIITSAGLSADTTKISVITVFPLPVQPTIEQLGGTCPGDTSIFVVSPFDSTLIPTWITSEVRLQETPDSLFIINGNSDYSVSVSIQNTITGCVSPLSDVITRTVNEIPVIVSIDQPDGPFCPSFSANNSMFEFIANITGADSISWSSNQAIFSDPNNDTTDVVFTVINDVAAVTVEAFGNGCDAFASETITFPVDTSFQVSYNIINDTLCENDSQIYRLDISGDVPPSELVSIVWTYNGDTISTADTAFVPSAQQNDLLTVNVDPNFCFDVFSVFSDSVTLAVVDRPGAILAIEGEVGQFMIEDITIPVINLTDDFQQTRQFLGLPNPNQWQWFWFDESGDSLSTIDIVTPTQVPFTQATPPNLNQPQFDITYFLVTDNDFCTDTSTAVLTIKFNIHIPNAFTPDDDNDIHDTWFITNLENFAPVNVEIFNRWGNLVFNSDDYDNSWDGLNNDGEELPFGTYFYIVTLGEGLPTFTGPVSILK